MSVAKDVMTAKPITLESSTSILDAVATFTKNKFSSVPVMTTMGEIAGQLTELVMVRALVLHQIQPEKYKKLVNCTDLLEPAFFAEPNDSISTVIKTMMKSPSRRVLIKSDGRHVMGIISPKDLLRHLMSDSPEAKAIQEVIKKMPSETGAP